MELNENITINKNNLDKANENSNYYTNPTITDKKKIIINKNNMKKGAIISYKKPTLIGLNNIGATSFINATLQCLSQTEALTNYFLNKKNKNKIINNIILLGDKRDIYYN